MCFVLFRWYVCKYILQRVGLDRCLSPLNSSFDNVSSFDE
jgi:hypothetical protein